MTKPITVEDLGLTQKQIEDFVKGARIAYGTDPLASEQPATATPKQNTLAPTMPVSRKGYSTGGEVTEPSNMDMYRQDGSLKSSGFMGPLPHAGGSTSTELSIGVNMDGRETLIPSIVPTLSSDEIDHLLSGNDPTPSIVSKAVAHARKRMAAGMSPFFNSGEVTPLTD